MFQLFRLASTLILLLAATAARGTAYDIALTSTVLITAPLPNGTAYAAGVIVRDDTFLFVLTAAHVAQNQDLKILTSGGEQLRVQSVQLFPGHDLALLQTTTASQQYPTPVLAPVTPSADELYLWGFPESTSPARAVASISDLSPVLPDGDANGRFTIVCESCDHGDSGSGIFTREGRLIGILTAAWKNRRGVVRMIVAEPALPALSALATSAATALR